MSKTKEIAQRLKGLRNMLEISPEAAANACGIGVEKYLEYESGKTDLPVSILFNCAEFFGVDVTELFSGNSPKLGQYTVVRAGKGMEVERREGFSYRHLASNFKNREAEPFLVTAPYKAEEQDKEIPLSVHAGQELDYILSGRLKIVIGGKTEVLEEGDAAYYDSGLPHGMIATGGKPCVFLAVVLKKNAEA
jgi:mannose-6-phosphate isomerase-like protein (cupin superfamily)